MVNLVPAAVYSYMDNKDPFLIIALEEIPLPIISTIKIPLFISLMLGNSKVLMTFLMAGVSLSSITNCSDGITPSKGILVSNSFKFSL